MNNLNRPTSPYLTVYRLQSGSFFSIFSRITGLFLLICLFLPFLFMFLAPTGMSFYFFYSLTFFLFKTSLGCVFFFFLVILFLTSLLYHLFSALRYVFWSHESGLYNDVFNLYSLKRTQTYFLLFPVSLVLLSWFIFLIA